MPAVDSSANSSKLAGSSDNRSSDENKSQRSSFDYQDRNDDSSNAQLLQSLRQQLNQIVAPNAGPAALALPGESAQINVTKVASTKNNEARKIEMPH